MNPSTAWETDPQRQEIRILARRVWVAWYSGQHARARGFAERLNALLLEMSGFERDDDDTEIVSFVRIRAVEHTLVGGFRSDEMVGGS